MKKSNIRLSVLKRMKVKHIISMMIITLFLSVSPAFATPVLTNPANGSTVTNNYPVGSPVGWNPFMQWNDSQYPNLNSRGYFVEIATSPALGQYNLFLMNNVVANNSLMQTTTWNPTGYLTAGTYYWHVQGNYGFIGDYIWGWSPIGTFTVPQATPAPASLPIIGYSPSSLYFVANQGGSNPPSRILTISNSGGQALYWETSDNMTWLNDVAGGNEGEVIISVDISGKTPGIYNGIYTITGKNSANTPAINSPSNLNVTLEIKAPGEVAVPVAVGTPAPAPAPVVTPVPAPSTGITPAPTPPTQSILKTVLSLNASPKSIILGKATTIKGQLRGSNGQYVRGKKVKIKANGKVFKTVTTNAAGVFSFKHKPKKNTKYQAVYNGDSSYSVASSKSVKVTVKKKKKK